MYRLGRAIEIILGLFFLVTAAMKAWNLEGFGVQISAYGVVKDAGLVTLSAYAAVTIETLLGAALVAGARLKGLTYLAVTGLTLVFSGLILYGWLAKGIEDCGCFGDFIKMGPRTSLAKNGVLLALLAVAWVGVRAPLGAPKRRRLGWEFAIAGIVAVLVVGLVGQLQARGDAPDVLVQVDDDPEKRKLARFRFEVEGETIDLGEGEYLVAMLSATCEHCQASVPAMNALYNDPDLPRLVALMMGSEEDLEFFRTLTDPQFITQLVRGADFMEFIDTSPPRLLYARDGREMAAWDWLEEAPSVEVVAQGISEAD